MRMALFGKEAKSMSKTVEKAGFTVVESDPELVLSFGGDGTFLESEYAYPGVPKALIKNSPTCRLCTELPLDEVLEKLKWGDYSVFDVIKLQVLAGDKAWYALNDIVVHNNDPRRAIRFNVRVGGHVVREVIGDGIVVATVLGSTGYYHSINKMAFNSGIGVAFNNASRLINPIHLSEENFDLTCEIIRGPAVVYADNQPGEINLSDGESVRITTSQQRAHVLTFD